MNTPLSKSIVFTALLLALLLLVQQFLLMELRNYRAGDLGTWYKVTNGKVNADIIILGSSRAHEDADPAILTAITGKSSYNLGREGTSPDIQSAFFDMYLRHNRTPQYLVLCVDSFTLAPDWLKIFLPQQYIAHLNEPEITAVLSRREPIWRLYHIFPLIGFVRLPEARESAIRALISPAPNDDLNGFLPIARSWTDEFSRFEASHPNGITFAVADSYKEYLRNLLALCRRRHIRAVLVFPPEYIESQKMTLNRREVMAAYQEISKEYEIPFWDYSSDLICEKKEFFYNSQHLNAQGATLFSRDCADRLEALINATQRQDGKL